MSGPATPARRSTEEQLRLQAKLLDAVGQAVIAVDPHGIVEFWNAAAESLYGWTAAEAIGRPLADLVYADSARVMMPPLFAAAARGESWSGESERHHRNGHTFVAHVMLSPLLDDAGQFVGTVSVNADITTRLHNEAELRRQALVFGTITDAVVTIDTDGAVVDWNPAAFRLFGYTKEEMLGRHMSELHDPEISGTQDRSIRAALAADGNWSGEICYYCKYGTTALCEVYIVAHHDSAGVAVGYIGVN
ncbi:MAG: PAS domain-containing protein, partial [Gemmatimonadaceae bacterium]